MKKYIKLNLTLKEKLLLLFYSLVGEKHLTSTGYLKHRHGIKHSKYDEKKAMIRKGKAGSREMKKVPFFDLAEDKKIKRQGDW